MIFKLQGKVTPKARPRFFKGRAILPENYRKWKDRAIEQLTSQWNGETIEKAEVTIALYGSMRGDIDNISGSILDALVQSGILTDDRLSVVPSLAVRYYPNKQTPSAIVTINPIADSFQAASSPS